MARKSIRAKRIMTRNDWLPRLPFIIAVFVGGLIISLLKIKEIDQIYVSLIAVIFMITYALSVMLVPSLRLREDQLGDNCYYLGFLYTLGSLVWALYAFAYTNDVEDIIANFGLALFSTIVGIMLRVVINQSRKDILETERECRIELSSAVARMRSNIDEATFSLESFCRLTQQMLQENISNTVSHSTKVMENCATSLQNVNEQVIASINHSLESHTQYTEKLNKVVSGIEHEINSVITKLKNIDIDKNMISTQLEPVTSQVAKTLTDISEQTSNAFKVIEREMLSIADRLQYVEVDKEIIHTKLAPISAHIEDTLGQLTKTMKEHNSALNQEIVRSKQTTIDLTNALSDLAQSIHEKIS